MRQGTAGRADQEDEYEEEAEREEADLTLEEVDLYEMLKLARDGGRGSGERKDQMASRARAAYHRQSTKWHPSNFKGRPVVCDECSLRLAAGKGWYHFRGDFYDLCEADFQSLDENEKDSYSKVEELSDLGGEEEAYKAEISRFQARETAVLRFRRVGLAYRVLKDPELRRIYDECGWSGLTKAESYAEESAFEADFFRQYEEFFSGVDEDDRQYLLLNGPNPLSDDEAAYEEADEEEAESTAAAGTSTETGEASRSTGGDTRGGSAAGGHEEEEEAEEEEEEEEEEDPILAEAAAAAAEEEGRGGGEAGGRKQEEEALRLPPPPVMLAAKVMGGGPGERLAMPVGDPWKALARKRARAEGEGEGDAGSDAKKAAGEGEGEPVASG